MMSRAALNRRLVPLMAVAGVIGGGYIVLNAVMFQSESSHESDKNITLIMRTGSDIAGKHADSGKKANRKRKLIRSVQRQLVRLGYQPGAVNGVASVQTRAAILAYEHDHGLVATAEPDQTLLKRLLFGAHADGKTHADDQLDLAPPTAAAIDVTRLVQQALARLGYAPGVVDGRAHAETVQAIRRFESDNGLTVTGRISGRLVAEMRRKELPDQMK